MGGHGIGGPRPADGKTARARMRHAEHPRPVMKPAVDRFQGEGCDAFSDQLAAALGSATSPVTGKPAFTVLHRRDIEVQRTGVACEFSDRCDDARNALEEAYALGHDDLCLAGAAETRPLRY